MITLYLTIDIRSRCGLTEQDSDIWPYMTVPYSSHAICDQNIPCWFIRSHYMLSIYIRLHSACGFYIWQYCVEAIDLGPLRLCDWYRTVLCFINQYKIVTYCTKPSLFWGIFTIGKYKYRFLWWFAFLPEMWPEIVWFPAYMVLNDFVLCVLSTKYMYIHVSLLCITPGFVSDSVIAGGTFYSLAPGRCGCNFELVISKLISGMDILSISREIVLWSIPQDLANGDVSIGLGNDSVPSGKKPLPEAMLT